MNNSISQWWYKQCPPYNSTQLVWPLLLKNHAKRPPPSEEVNHQFYIYFCTVLPPLHKRQRWGSCGESPMCKFFVHCSSLLKLISAFLASYTPKRTSRMSRKYGNFYSSYMPWSSRIDNFENNRQNLCSHLKLVFQKIVPTIWKITSKKLTFFQIVQAIFQNNKL